MISMLLSQLLPQLLSQFLLHLLSQILSQLLPQLRAHGWTSARVGQGVGLVVRAGGRLQTNRTPSTPLQSPRETMLEGRR